MGQAPAEGFICESGQSTSMGCVRDAAYMQTSDEPVVYMPVAADFFGNTPPMLVGGNGPERFVCGATDAGMFAGNGAVFRCAVYTPGTPGIEVTPVGGYSTEWVCTHVSPSSPPSPPNPSPPPPSPGPDLPPLPRR